MWYWLTMLCRFNWMAITSEKFLDIFLGKLQGYPCINLWRAGQALLLFPAGGPSLHQGSCQPPLMTQSGRLTPFQPGELQEQQLVSQGLHSQAGMDSHHFGICHSLDGLLYVGSQNSDRALPLSGQPLPSPPN